MNAGGGHSPRRRVIGLQAPVVAVERQKLVVAEVRLDLMNAAEVSPIGFCEHRRNRRIPTPLVAHSENQSCALAQADSRLGPRLGERQRLLAEYVLPRSGGICDLRLV